MNEFKEFEEINESLGEEEENGGRENMGCHKIAASSLSHEMVHGEVDDGRPDLPYHMMDKVPHPIEAKYHQSMDQNRGRCSAQRPSPTLRK